MKKKSTSVKSQTDFARLDKMKDEDIDYSDAPAITPEMFAKAIVRRGLKPRTKTQLTLRVDSDVLDWYKKQAQLMYTLQERIVNFLRVNGEYVKPTPCNFIIIKNRILHNFLEKHKIVIRSIGSEESRITIPSVENTKILINILSKYYLLRHVDIWCICLEERNDRYICAKTEFERMNIDDVQWHRPKRDIRGGEIGCWESHKYCMHHSQKELTLIFEDDVKFTNEIDWTNIHQFVFYCPVKWDTFHIGCHLISLENRVNDQIWKVKCNGGHAYIIKKEIGASPDYDPYKNQGGVDDYYRRYLRQYALIDTLCLQREGLQTDNVWFPGNPLQNIFQNPNWYEFLQKSSNFIAKSLRFLPQWAQPIFNPIPCSLMINAFVYNILRKIQLNLQ